MKTYKPSEGDSTMVESPDGEYILKKDVQPIIDTYNKIKDELLNEKDIAINYIISIIKNQEDYEELQDIPVDEIALHINNYDKDSYEFHFLFCRLANENPFEKNLGKCTELLHDQEFNVEDYREIGKNDGVINILFRLFNIIGLEKKAKEVYQAIYSD